MKQDLDVRFWQARFYDYMKLVRGWTERTIEGYRSELKPFLGFLERQGVTQIGRLTRAHLEGYRLELSQLQSRGKPLTGATQQRRLCAIKQFAKFLYRENYLLLDLGAGFEIPFASQALPRIILSEVEVVRLLEFPDTQEPTGLRDRALLELLYGTAIRNSELCQLLISQVDLGQGMLHIERGKGGKSRVVPLGEEAQAWLEEYLQKARPLWLDSPHQKRVFLSGRGRYLTRQWLALRVRTLGERAGLAKVATPHGLRHSCATHMLRRGAGIRHLQTLLGHAYLNTTQIYTRVEVSDLAKVVRKFHPREAP